MSSIHMPTPHSIQQDIMKHDNVESTFGNNWLDEILFNNCYQWIDCQSSLSLSSLCSARTRTQMHSKLVRVTFYILCHYFFGYTDNSYFIYGMNVNLGFNCTAGWLRRFINCKMLFILLFMEALRSYFMSIIYTDFQYIFCINFVKVG